MRFHSVPDASRPAATLLTLLAMFVALVAAPSIVAAKPGLASPSIADEAVERTRPTIRLVAHHEDEDDDDHRHERGRWDDDDDEHEDEHDEDEFDDDIEQIEIERVFVEMERASLETVYGSMELVEKITEIAADDDRIATLAVTSITDILEPDEAEEMLLEVAERAPGTAVRRVARLQLAELYGEQGNIKGVRKQLRILIFGEN